MNLIGSMVGMPWWVCRCCTYYSHVNFHDVANMKLRPINAVDRFLKASERLVVAAFLMICVSSDSLLKSSPVRVTSKKAIS